MSFELAPLARADVSAVITFNRHDPKCDEIQSEGVAALCNIMSRKDFAYLADEVGMGKTWQAMGAIALTLRQNPAARIVVICPGADLQRKWINNWIQFVRDSYLPHDDLIKNRFDGGITLEAVLSERLKDFAEHLMLDFQQLHVLRYSSFSRPVWVEPKSSQESIKGKYLEWIQALGCSKFDDEEEKAFAGVNTHIKTWREDFSRTLNDLYARRVGMVVAAKPIDLLVLDEAQYLRTDNARNTHLQTIFPPECVMKVLFLSATPVHNQKKDLIRLKDYLGQDLLLSSADGAELVESMKKFMVRRLRTYEDKKNNAYSKHMYRDYDSLTIDPRDDAYYSLVLALVQKRLGKVLDGKGNIFRFGECSSFESLSSSTERYQGNRTAETTRENSGSEEKETEYEKLEGRGTKRKEEESPDRSFLDRLAKSFKTLPSPSQPLVLPHAKVDESVKYLAEHHLSAATLEKGIVFVRRLDTVDELKLRLEEEFQKEIDRRIKNWDAFLALNGLEPLKDFWVLDERDDLPEEDDPGNTIEETDDSRLTGREIQFLVAHKKKRTHDERNGKLYSFANRLLRPKDPERRNPLLFLVDQNEAEHEATWAMLLSAIGAGPVLAGEDPTRSLKRRALKRFLLQTMRRSDFIVDLFIMNRVRGRRALHEVLLEFFEGTFAPGSGSVTVGDFLPLKPFLHNWRQRLLSCVSHWEVILSNCFAPLSEEGMNAQIDAIFYHMTPVSSRSGRVKGEQTVNQFKLPGYPNLLICTDVLKEGIDLHLFCDRVYHYGIAWTSGDLEQRIGRVDRFLSKISRSISSHKGEIANVPKLKVLFPTLAGTLDARQVEHVRRRKAVADLMMDFGETLKESGEHRTDELYGALTKRAHDARFQDSCVFDAKPHLAISPRGWVLSETERARDPKLGELAANALRMVAPEWQPKHGWRSQGPEDKVWQIRYLPHFKALKLTVREPASELASLSLDTRLLWHKINSKWGFYSNRDLLLPTLHTDWHAKLVAEFTRHGAVTQSFRPNSPVHGFTRDPERGAVVWERKDPVSQRRHRLFLEIAGDAYLLRSYVAKGDWNNKPGGRFRFLAALNRHCRVGHFHLAGDYLFHLVLLHDQRLITESLLEQVAIFSDSIQLWLTAADDGDFHYTTPCSVRGIVDPWLGGELKEWQKTFDAVFRRAL